MEQISLPVADGSKMLAHFQTPAKEAKAGVIVLQEAFGVNQHIKDLVKKFAGEGYLAIAPELYHRTAEPGFTVGYGDFQLITNHFSAVTEQTMHQDVQACFDWMAKSHGVKSVAAIGYCMGGRVAFAANAYVPLKCAISYYGGRIVPTLLPLSERQKSPLLFFWGGLDKHIPTEQIQTLNQALTAAKKNFTCVEIADADHGFSCDERPSYNAVATRQASALTKQFLNEYL